MTKSHYLIKRGKKIGIGLKERLGEHEELLEQEEKTLGS